MRYGTTPFLGTTKHRARDGWYPVSPARRCNVWTVGSAIQSPSSQHSVTSTGRRTFQYLAVLADPGLAPSPIRGREGARPGGLPAHGPAPPDALARAPARNPFPPCSPGCGTRRSAFGLALDGCTGLWSEPWCAREARRLRSGSRIALARGRRRSGGGHDLARLPHRRSCE